MDHLLCFIFVEIITATLYSISIYMVLRIATVEAGNEPTQGVTFPQPAFILNDTLYDPVQRTQIMPTIRTFTVSMPFNGYLTVYNENIYCLFVSQWLFLMQIVK